MNPTEKLYDLDAYATAFTAEVLAINWKKEASKASETDDGKLAEVILDRTCFFPEGGGQCGDQGVLAGIPVVDTQIDKGVIRHILRGTSEELEAAKVHVGAQVEGRVDFARRFEFMQHHTGEHILSGLMHARYGFNNVGFRLSEHTCTLDVNGQLDEEQILALEKEANEVVFRNIPVAVSYPPEEVLQELPYRSKIEIEDAVRIVEIEGVDICACCAPHVARTGEIGLIKIVKVLHNKESMRLWILCGRKAVSEMQDRQKILEEISHMTNRPQEGADRAVAELMGEVSVLRAKVRDLAYEAAFLRIENIPDEQEHVFLFAPPMEPLVHRNLVNKLVEKHHGYCAVFCGSDVEGYRYIAASAALDSREISKILREEFTAKGGGKPVMVQGSVTGTEEAIRSALTKYI